MKRMFKSIFCFSVVLLTLACTEPTPQQLWLEMIATDVQAKCGLELTEDQLLRQEAMLPDTVNASTEAADRICSELQG